MYRQSFSKRLPLRGVLLFSAATTLISIAWGRTAFAQESPFRIVEVTSSADDRSTPGRDTDGCGDRHAGQALDRATLESIFRRVPDLEAPTELESFRVPVNQRPPPEADKTPAEKRPRGASTSTPESRADLGPLRVVRFSPQGQIERADHIRVSFSQPMVPLGGQRLPLERIPVQVEPEISGVWRWLDTRTLLFEPQGPYLTRYLPMATDYRVKVPRGTSSLSGAKLDAEAIFQFSTALPKVVRFHPSKWWVGRNAPIVFVFNQAVDEQSVLSNVTVRAGERAIPVRLATREEVEKDVSVENRERQAEHNRYKWSSKPQDGSILEESRDGFWVALRGLEPLDGEVSVTLAAGVQSSTGLRHSEEPQTFRFKVMEEAPADAFAVKSHSVDSIGKFQIEVRFTSEPDPASVQAEDIRILPELSARRIAVSYSTLRIDLEDSDATEIVVILPGTLRDRKGRELGEEVALTFQVPRESPGLYFRGHDKVLLDPGRPPGLSFYSVNVDTIEFSLYGVGPEDWAGFRQYLRWLRKGRWEEDSKEKEPKIPGRLLFTGHHSTKGKRNTLTENRVDFSGAFAHGVGHAVAVVRGIASRPETLPQDEEEKVEALFVKGSPHVLWLERTFLSVAALWDRTELTAWVTDLRNRSVLDGVEISFYPNSSGTTTRDSFGTLKLQSLEPEPTLLLARKGDDLAILEASGWRDPPGWFINGESATYRCVLMLDRSLYRSGQRVHVKGWLRKVDMTEGGDVMLPDVKQVAYVVSGEGKIERGTAELTKMGGFDASFLLPGDRGESTKFSVRIPGHENALAEKSVPVADYRRPEFELSMAKSRGPHLAEEAVEVSVQATYLTTGALPNATVKWDVSSSPAQLTIPGWPGFSFGTWSPWWGDVDEDFHVSEAVGYERLEGRTDESGLHRLKIEVEKLKRPRPLSVICNATVLDLNRQERTRTARVLVLPANRLIGLRPGRSFGVANEPMDVELIVTDPNGQAVPGVPVRCELVRVEWVDDDSGRKRKEKDWELHRLVSAESPVSVRFIPERGGTYLVRAHVVDGEGRKAEADRTIWVSGAEHASRRTPRLKRLELIPDRRIYSPGDTARVLVKSPLYPAVGIVSLVRSGILWTRQFSMDGPDHTLEVPISDEHLPQVILNVEISTFVARPPGQMKGADTETKPKPLLAYLTLDVSLVSRQLHVTAKPRRTTLGPGEDTFIDITVRDSNKNGVPDAEICLSAVDDAVFALRRQRIPNLVGDFHSIRPGNARLRWNVFNFHEPSFEKVAESVKSSRFPVPTLALDSLPNPNAVPGVPFTAIDLDPGQDSSSSIRLRRDFRATAVFEPAVTTDENGKASVNVKLPGTLTRYRITAIAATANRFGHAKAYVTASQPLMVRPSPPRFVNRGDRFDMTVLVQNGTERDLAIDVALRAHGFEWSAPDSDQPSGILTGRRVMVAGLDRREIRFPARALRPGLAMVQAAAVSDVSSDGAEIRFPIREPMPVETVAVYGQLGPKEESVFIQQGLLRPRGTRDDYGGLEIGLSSTRLQSLSEGVRYLVDYPYGCAEQVASRLLATTVLFKSLASLALPGLPDAKHLRDRIDLDLARLQGLQAYNGGWSYWRRGDSDPYLSAHVAHSLLRATRAGFGVEGEVLDQWETYVKEDKRRFRKEAGAVVVPELTGEESVQPENLLIHAYALYVRNLRRDSDSDLGAAVREEARNWFGSVPLHQLPLEAAAWSLAIFGSHGDSQSEATAIRHHLDNRVKETARSASIENPVEASWRRVLPSSLRAHAVYLEALVESDPTSALIPKLANGLLDRRSSRGRWSTTEENAFALLAIGRYFQSTEAQNPDFVGRAWLDETLLYESPFHGRGFKTHSLFVPTRGLGTGGTEHRLTLSKEGVGSLFYQARLRYALADFDVPLAQSGFEVSRAYEGVGVGSGVESGEDGVIRVKAGALVRVRIFVFTPSARQHVALVDPYPAGFENGRESVRSWRPTWKTGAGELRRLPFGHTAFRDDAAEVFVNALPRGFYVYEYLIRATTPGVFVAPPPKVEAMYEPEVFGYGAVQKVRIVGE